ncbi:universal stress protein [Streptomyces spectabilis]|uniref:Nucleotide-binding universal stress UspA family protein n=1 Tax=Streptomyces spectabilis TaxID=68270 RepID=A0A5P2XHX3_STRST|nr:universal stress protein [Streptomyces spectabilis]MBB5102386.1 nucleotide-binding universal stress UspA family protein [Streptomyces spectabilis]MCI3907431.1 universal stress protein [Streptomyces spectabilis]QEV64141.1 universal stress protein [Streptomyces spectabilis]GGV32133.1 universal stress protein [Streptomyces spectabilis]
MTRQVIAGVDESRESRAAAVWAACEASRREVPPRLLHVRAWCTPVSSGASESASRRPVALRVLRAAEQYVRAACPGVRVASEQAEGPGSRALLSAAEEAAVLVLGFRGLSALTGFVLGSVARAVVARASCPVVLVRVGRAPDDRWRYDARRAGVPRAGGRDVVLGLDLNDPCDEVIDFAFDAARLRNTGVRVVSAWRAPSVLSLGPGEVGLIDGPQWSEERRGFQSAVLCTWRDKYPTVAVTGDIVEGRASPPLVRAAAEACLLVVGRRTREEPYVGTRTGPVTHAVSRHARCPVAVVPHS